MGGLTLASLPSQESSMSTSVGEAMMQQLGELRHEPIEKRIRATFGEDAVVDTTRALLVWEPKRVVPSYAVPVEDVAGEVVDTGGDAPAATSEPEAPQLAGRPVYDPSIPFAVHTAEGRRAVVRARGDREADAFRPSDPDLERYVILDFDAFDAW